MIAEDLKSRIGGLTVDERHELSAYLTKLELENDPVQRRDPESQRIYDVIPDRTGPSAG